MAHAKAVLFVHNQQAQVFVFNRCAQQLVRTHHNVYAAIGQAFDSCGNFFATAKAAHLHNFDGPFAKTIGQRSVVLFGQQRGGREDGHLLAARHCDKRGAQSYLSFTKADVAAHQAVHRLRAVHVLDDRMDGSALVSSFFKAEIVGKAFVVVG